MFERVYPFAWLGILAKAPPTHEELIYAYHERGFALYSMRSPEITRLYLQVAPDEDIAQWPDDKHLAGAAYAPRNRRRLEADRRPGARKRALTGMRSFVTEPMQYGRLFLAGDAAHIVPPTGAKGMNLAMADVRTLARALSDVLRHRARRQLAAYSHDVPAAHLARRAFFVVDDVDAAPVSERRRLRPPLAALAARLRRRLAARLRRASPKTTSACRSPTPDRKPS